jgi:TPP-dependent pyruvate/acetoin dehydrogenase alpha subunit
MNFAAVLRLPLVVIIENNQYAYSTPVSRQSLLKDLADKAKAFGIPGYVGDGNDVLEVYRLTKRCVDDARSGGGAQLLEFKTFRMRGHAPHDDQAYVPKELIAEWKKKDPIDRFEQVLGLSEEEKDAVTREVDAQVDDAVRFAEQSPFPDGQDAWRGVFADDSIVQFTPWWRRDA